MILAFVFRFILFVLGYKIDKSVVDYIRNGKQHVIIFPHTTKFEGIIGCLFLASFKRFFCFGVASSQMDLYGYILAYFGGFRIENLKKGSGTVKSISEFLILNKDKSLFLSPEGDLDAVEWKSGFFHIAKETGIPITIAGIDFVDHIIKMSDVSFTITKEDNFIKNIGPIKEAFANSKIYPYYPEGSNPKIPCTEKTTLFDYISVLLWCGMITISVFYKEIGLTYTLISLIALYQIILTRYIIV